MFGPDPLTDPLGFFSLWLMLYAVVRFATTKTPFL